MSIISGPDTLTYIPAKSGIESLTVPEAIPFTGLPAGVGDSQTRELWSEVQRLTEDKSFLQKTLKAQIDAGLQLSEEVQRLTAENAELRKFNGTFSEIYYRRKIEKLTAENTELRAEIADLKNKIDEICGG